MEQLKSSDERAILKSNSLQGEKSPYFKKEKLKITSQLLSLMDRIIQFFYALCGKALGSVGQVGECDCKVRGRRKSSFMHAVSNEKGPMVKETRELWIEDQYIYEEP